MLDEYSTRPGRSAASLVARLTGTWGDEEQAVGVAGLRHAALDRRLEQVDERVGLLADRVAARLLARRATVARVRRRRPVLGVGADGRGVVVAGEDPRPERVVPVGGVVRQRGVLQREGRLDAARLGAGARVHRRRGLRDRRSLRRHAVARVRLLDGAARGEAPDEVVARALTAAGPFVRRRG